MGSGARCSAEEDLVGLVGGEEVGDDVLEEFGGEGGEVVGWWDRLWWSTWIRHHDHSVRAYCRRV